MQNFRFRYFVFHSLFFSFAFFFFLLLPLKSIAFLIYFYFYGVIWMVTCIIFYSVIFFDEMLLKGCGSFENYHKSHISAKRVSIKNNSKILLLLPQLLVLIFLSVVEKLNLNKFFGIEWNNAQKQKKKEILMHKRNGFKNAKIKRLSEFVK